jgi:hypothetical protein
VSHSRANPAKSEAGRADSALNAEPEEEANWLPAPTLLMLADEVIEEGSMSVHGTFRKCRDVRSSVANGRKADVARAAHFGSE